MKDSKWGIAILSLLGLGLLLKRKAETVPGIPPDLPADYPAEIIPGLPTPPYLPTPEVIPPVLASGFSLRVINPPAEPGVLGLLPSKMAVAWSAIYQAGIYGVMEEVPHYSPLLRIDAPWVYTEDVSMYTKPYTTLIVYLYGFDYDNVNYDAIHPEFLWYEPLENGADYVFDWSAWTLYKES